jgi:hypothetical protein
MGRTSVPETLVIHQKLMLGYNPKTFKQHYDRGGSLQLHITVVQFLAGARNVLFSEVSRPAMGPTQLPIQCVLEIFSQGYSSWGMKLTTHLIVMLMLRIGVVGPLPLHFHGVHRDNITFTLI